jgi:ribosomal subunit interface protein
VKVVVRDRKVEVTQALRMHVERRLGLALGRFSDKVAQVTVLFSEVGALKRCQIEIGVRSPRLLVEDTDVDLFAAVDHATERASRALARALDRERALTEDTIPSRPRRRGG